MEAYGGVIKTETTHLGQVHSLGVLRLPGERVAAGDGEIPPATTNHSLVYDLEAALKACEHKATQLEETLVKGSGELFGWRSLLFVLSVDISSR